MPGDIFEQLPLFRDLSSTQLRLLRPMFIPSECYPGMVLFEQGDPAEFLYLVVAGEVVIRYKPEDGPTITVTRVHSGGVVGWSAALGNRVYTSAAVCSDCAQMLRVRGSDLRKLCEDDPETGILVLERLAWIIAERLHNTHEQVVTLLKQGLHSGIPSM